MEKTKTTKAPITNDNDKVVGRAIIHEARPYSNRMEHNRRTRRLTNKKGDSHAS